MKGLRRSELSMWQCPVHLFPLVEAISKDLLYPRRSAESEDFSAEAGFEFHGLTLDSPRRLRSSWIELVAVGL